MTTVLTTVADIEAELQRRLSGDRGPFPVIRPCLTGDGLEISVQASRTHYCSPQANEGPYTSVEVLTPHGHPGRHVSKLLRGIDGYPSRRRQDWSQPMGWVPIRSVAQAIAAAGGLIANR